MFGTVLLAVDGSKHAEKAVDLATQLVQDDAEVVVLHVTEILPARFQTVTSADYTSDTEAIELAKRYAKDLGATGVKARTEFRHIRYGHVARVIVEAAEELGADVIVMGSHGRSDLTAVLLGSVAHKVLHHADRPVLIAR
jgi:nucleotide-binding universal stress UspA family protein